MRFHQLDELLKGPQTLPPQRRLPLVEKAPRPARTPIAPELIERFLEQVRFVQTTVGLEQQLQCLLPFEGEVFPMRQQRVPLPLDEAAIFSRQPGVLAL